MSSPLPAFNPAARPRPDALELFRHFNTLKDQIPAAPVDLVYMAAFLLAAPLTSSDAILVVSEAMTELATLQRDIARGEVIQQLASRLADEAPRFAGRAP